MADVNGLKEANDTCGHEAGDELLTATANSLTYVFENTGTVYRIGGDEFCVITHCTPEQTTDLLKILDATIESWHGKYAKSLSLAYGIASTQDSNDIASIIKKADHRMYDHKRDYYARSGNDRRANSYIY